MSSSILTLTENHATVKVVGNTPETITLASLMSPTQERAKDSLGADVPFKVGINFVQWAVGTSAVITRGGVTVLELAGSPGSINFSSDLLSTDYTEKDKDLNITITGNGTVVLKLRKAAGYKSKIEPEYFGQYDDPTKVGE